MSGKLTTKQKQNRNWAGLLSSAGDSFLRMATQKEQLIRASLSRLPQREILGVGDGVVVGAKPVEIDGLRERDERVQFGRFGQVGVSAQIIGAVNIGREQ